MSHVWTFSDIMSGQLFQIFVFVGFKVFRVFLSKFLMSDQITFLLTVCLGIFASLFFKLCSRDIIIAILLTTV